MFDTLKKIGVPTAIATAIVVIAMAVPFLFKIDERYAKQTQLEAEISRLEKRNHELTVELAQNAGFQSAMIALIQQGRVPSAASVTAPVAAIAAPTPATAPVRVTPAPRVDAVATPSAPRAIEKPRTWTEIGEAVTRQQQRLLAD